MRYQQEFLSSVYIEIQALIQLHWEQIALNQDEIKLNPDWDQYEAAEAGESGEQLRRLLYAASPRRRGKEQVISSDRTRRRPANLSRRCTSCYRVDDQGADGARGADQHR